MPMMDFDGKRCMHVVGSVTAAMWWCRNGVCVGDGKWRLIGEERRRRVYIKFEKGKNASKSER